MGQGQVWFVWWFMIIGNVTVECSEENLEIEVPEKFRPLSAYLIGLKAKRKEQLGFVLNMAKGNNNYKLAQLAFDTVVQTLEEQREKLKADDQIDFGMDALVPNPTKLEKRNLGTMQAISSIYENCAFLGDIARRLPHYISKLWNETTKDKKDIIIWAMKKTKESIVYEYDVFNLGNQPGKEKSSMLYLPLYFFMQELDLEERDPNYINEFKVIRDAPMNETHEEFLERHAEAKREKKKAKQETERIARRKRGLNPPVVIRSVEL